MTKNEVNEAITDCCKNLAKFLIDKNNAYNNSLHDPVQTFSKLQPIEGILCRIDDKLNRIKKSGINDKTEDTVTDLIGYLIHLEILNKKL